MILLKQRGAIAFVFMPPAVVVALLDIAVELALANDADALAGVFDQTELPRLLAHLILVPAQEARRLRERLPVIEGVRQVCNVHFGPGLARVRVHRPPR